MKRAIYVIFFTYLTCIFFCIPSYFTFTIKSREPMVLEYCLEDYFEPMPIANYDKTVFSKLNSNRTFYENYDQSSLASLKQDQVEPDLQNKNRMSKNEKIKRTKLSPKDVNLRNLIQMSRYVNTENSIIDQRYMDKEMNRKSEYANQKMGAKISERNIKAMVLKTADQFIQQNENSSLSLREFYVWLGCCLEELAYKEICESVVNNTDLNTDLMKKFPEPNSNRTLTYRVTFSDNELLKKINFWIYSVLNKLVPCCALTYLSLALIRMLYQSNERRHRLRTRSHGQQTFYSQAASSSFYNTNPMQNQLPISSLKVKDGDKDDSKSLPNSPNASNPNLLDQNYKQQQTLNNNSTLLSSNKLTTNLEPSKMNESVSSTNLNNNYNLNQLKIDERTKKSLNEQSNESLQTNQSNLSINQQKYFLNNKPNSLTKDYQTDPNNNHSNQSLNQPLNLSSRNNSSASYIYPASILNASSFNNNRSCRLNNNTNCDRTTRMLLAILILFLITEFPSGLLNLLAAILGESFMENIYLNLGEVIDLLALINNGVNFILYCTMSRQFRKTFQKTFCCNCICLFKPISKKSSAKLFLNSQKAASQPVTLGSLPNEKLNLINQNLNQTGSKKISLNEIDDDDEELVTMNETKQNSSAGEMDYDLINDSQDNLNSSSKLRKSSVKQETIIECKENYDDAFMDGCKDSNLESASTRLTRQNTQTDSIANGSLKEVTINKQLNEELNDSNDKNEKESKDSGKIEVRLDNQTANLARFRMHRNSSIDSTSTVNNLESRRNKSLHRHNDSRRRYRRKTITNMENPDCKSSTCV